MQGTPPRDERDKYEGEPPPADEAAPEDVQAWQEIEAGRYMPRRIRGSCRGRSLG
jgi:hypothetical protein